MAPSSSRDRRPKGFAPPSARDLRAARRRAWLGLLGLFLFIVASGFTLVFFWQDPESGQSPLQASVGSGHFAPCALAGAGAEDCWDEAARALTLGLVVVDLDGRNETARRLAAQGIQGARRSPAGEPVLPSYRLFPPSGDLCAVQEALRQRSLEVLLLDGAEEVVMTCAEAEVLLVRLPRGGGS